MTAKENVLTKTAQDIIGARPASKAIEEIFNVIHPAPPRTALAEMFSRETAGQFLDRVSNFSALLVEGDSHASALAKLEGAIMAAERVRDQVLAELFKQIRPIERSYRMLHLFFENSEVKDAVQRPPVEFHLFNADLTAIGNPTESTTVLAVEEFLEARNDTFNFRQNICNMVIPGYVPDSVRKRFEESAAKWGMLLIGDLKDEPNFKTLRDQFRTDGGTYEFLKRPEDKAAADVVIAGHVKLRARHWFEEPDGNADDADLYAPASMLFAGCLARTDRMNGGGIAQGPVGMIFGQIQGVEKARIEPRIGQMEHLTMDRQVVAVIRDENNQLCFVGSRTQAEDPNGVLKFFTSYRVLRYLERRIAAYLRRIAEQPLGRDLVKEQVRNPIETFLDEEKKKGTILSYELDIDMSEDKFAMGELDMKLNILPVGPAETFRLDIEVPDFKKTEKK